MAVRTATAADVDAIRRVAERSWGADYPEILTRETAEQAVEEWYDPGRIDDELADDRTAILVAERDGSVVGFAHATWKAEGEGYILRLYVDPDHRRAGIGRSLLEHTCDRLADHDVNQVNAMVLAANDPGNAFYERFGFDRADQRETTIGGDSYRENRYVLEPPASLDVD